MEPPAYVRTARCMQLYAVVCCCMLLCAVVCCCVLLCAVVYCCVLLCAVFSMTDSSLIPLCILKEEKGSETVIQLL